MEQELSDLKQENRLLKMKINEMGIRIGGLLAKLHYCDKKMALLEIQEGKRIEQAQKEQDQP